MLFYTVIQCIYKFKGLNIEYYLSCRFCLSIMVLLCNFIIFLYCLTDDNSLMKF